MTINNQTIDLDARQILLKRGNLAVNNSYIGPIGEITLDTTNFTLRVHNGVTPGGVMVPTEPTTRTWITSYLEGNLAPIVAATVANTTSTITDLISNVSANVTALAANVEATFSQLVGNASSQLNTLEEIAISLDNDPALASNLRILITAVQSNLNTEVARAFAAETILQTNINNEANARIAADVSLQGNISAEAGIRSAADASLQSQINNILSNFDANILDSFTEVASTVSSLNSNISAEANARIAADNLLQSNLNSEASTRSSADSSLQANITAEVNARTQAVSDEANARISADTSLQSNITAEVNARIQAVSDEANARIASDTSLQSNITAEVNARTQAVSDEANARVLADTNLQSNITAEVNARTQAVSDEANARIASDTSLQSNITAEVNARIQAVNDEANARVLADTNLQSNITAEVNARIQAVSDEANARIASDTSLQSNITAEVNARTQAVSDEANARVASDTSLQSNITALDNSLATVAKSGSYPDLINRPNFTAFNSNIVPDTDVTYYLGNALHRWHSIYVGPGSLNVGNIRIGESVDGKLSVTTPIDLANSDIQWANVLNKPNFANIATSGAYSDLSGVPTNLNQFTNGPDFANVTYVNTLVTNEATARNTATSNLQSQINNILNNADPAALDSLSEIVTAFQNADGNLLTALNNLSSSTGSNLTAEINRATSAEANLQANISSEITARTQAVSDEANARIAADTSLQSNITAEVNARIQAVSDEANARVLSDTSLQSNITAETNARISADNSLQANITAEATARTNADNILQSNITAEVNARIQAVSDEANARIASDNILQSNITAEVNARIQAVSDEANARVLADTSLQSNITAEVNRATTAESSLQANITAEVNARIQAVSDEANARVLADTSLQSNITAETNARILADSNLQNIINSITSNLTAKTGNISFADTTMSAPDSEDIFVAAQNIKLVANDGVISHTWSFEADGGVRTPGNLLTIGGYTILTDNNNELDLGNGNDITIRSNIGGVAIGTDWDGVQNTWGFKADGNLELPNGTRIRDIGSVNSNTSGLELGNHGFQINFGSTVNDWAIFSGARLIQFEPGETFNINFGEQGWEFANTGNLIFPDNKLRINGDTDFYGAANTAVIAAANNTSLISHASGESGQVVLTWTEDTITPSNSNVASVFLNHFVNQQGVTIQTGVPLGDPRWWTFDNTGNLTLPQTDMDVSPAPTSLPGITFTDGTFQTTAFTGFASIGNIAVGNSRINFVANSSGDGAGYTTIELRPDTTASQEQYLVIDPTAPNHIHIRAGGTQDNSQAALYLGGENSYFQVASGLNPPVYVVANNNVWTFNVDGNFSLPGNVILNTPTNLQFLDPSAGPITVGALDSVANIGFSNGTYQTTAWTGSAPTVDVTNTNGLGTTFYPTFVESRTNGQYIRADVDLTYRTDTNTLTTSNVKVNNRLVFSNNTEQTTAWTGSVSSLTNGSYTASLDGSGVLTAQNFKTISDGILPGTYMVVGIGSMGYTSTTVESGSIDSLLITGYVGKATRIGSDGNQTGWTFTPNSNIIFPDSSIQSTAWTGSVDRIKNGSAEVVVANTGVISLPAVSNSQVTISGATKTVKGNPYSVRSAYSNEFEIWKASSEDVVAAKVTVRLHNDYYTYTELFDVMLVKEATNNANVSFSVGPRIKSNDNYPDGVVDVRLSDGNKLTLYYTSTQGDASFYTFDAVEFTKTV